MAVSASTSEAERVSVDAWDEEGLVAERVSVLVGVARDFETGVKLETLVDLLPEFGPPTPADLAEWLKAHPESARLSGDRVLAGNAREAVDTGDRRARAEEHWNTACRLLDSDLKATRTWLRLLAVTGSTAYGEPREGDDCDLMAIVRSGSVWVFLASVFLRLRLRRLRSPPWVEPEWCFNYTLDEEAAVAEFSRPRGFLFAREALIARPVTGEAYYRSLIRRGDWLRQEAPRLYARWALTPLLPEPTPPSPTSRGVRLLNMVLFPWLAAFLQLKGLWANHRLRRFGREDETFRTITQLGRMALQTQRFQHLSERMAPASRLSPE
jgi:hypothetical protein